MHLENNIFFIRFVMLIPVILSLAVHEWAHAWCAFKLGDDTAKRLGRLSFNPLVHIDPVGTLLLPLLGVPFGWAKPVPFNPLRFREGVNKKWGGDVGCRCRTDFKLDNCSVIFADSCFGEQTVIYAE